MSSPHASDEPIRSTLKMPPRPRGLAFILSIIILVLYSTFVYLVGYQKAFLGTTITPGLSWGILLGALVIIVSWALTLIYLVVSNKPAATTAKS